MKLNRFGLAVLSLITTLLIPLSAQEQERDPNILIFTHTSPVDAAIARSINAAGASRLNDDGFKTIQIADDVTVDALLEKAGWLGGFFLIEIRSGKTVSLSSLEINLYSTWDKQLLLSLYRESVQNGNIRDEVRRSMEKIIPVIKSHLADIRTSPPPPGRETDLQSDKASEKPEQAGRKEEASADLPSTPAPMNRRELSFTLGGAPLLATDEGAEYFSLGSHAFMAGTYSWPLPRLSLGTGARFGWDSFTAEGTLISSRVNIFYLGPEFMLDFDVRRGRAVFIRFCGGASIFTVSSEFTGFDATTIPFVSLGAGFTLPLSGKWSFYYSGDFTVHFESSTSFSGFYPALGINYGL